MDGAFALVMRPLLYLKMDTFGNSKRKKKRRKNVFIFSSSVKKMRQSGGIQKKKTTTTQKSDDDMLICYFIYFFFLKGFLMLLRTAIMKTTGSVMDVARSWKPSITVYTYTQPTHLYLINISSRASFVRFGETDLPIMAYSRNGYISSL